MRLKKHIEKQELLSFLKTHTYKEAAKFFNVGVKTINTNVKNHNLSYEKIKYGDYQPFNQEIFSIIQGSLLGDGCIERSRFRMGQTYSKKEYIDWLALKLSPYSKEPYEETTICNNKEFKSYRFYTCCHSQFRDLYELWYPNGKKIIPKNLTLNEISFLHWFLHDGCNNPKKRALTIATNCFSVEDVEFLIALLKTNLSINATINMQKNHPTIHIGSYEYDKTTDLLSRHNQWNCFEYKSDTSKAPLKTNLGACKLNYHLAEEIRKHRASGKTVKTIADQYQVCLQTVYNILNGFCYPEPKSESAIVSVIYNLN